MFVYHNDGAAATEGDGTPSASHTTFPFHLPRLSWLFGASTASDNTTATSISRNNLPVAAATGEIHAEKQGGVDDDDEGELDLDTDDGDEVCGVDDNGFVGTIEERLQEMFLNFKNDSVEGEGEGPGDYRGAYILKARRPVAEAGLSSTAAKVMGSDDDYTDGRSKPKGERASGSATVAAPRATRLAVQRAAPLLTHTAPLDADDGMLGIRVLESFEAA